MQFVAVIVAAVVAYGFGALWYTKMSKPWIAISGIPVGPDGKPLGSGNPMPFVVGFAAELLVAGMMRHIFVQAHLYTFREGIMGGFGIGAFLITPWVAMNYAFAARPYKLTALDSVNAIVGCTLMGIVLALL